MFSRKKFENFVAITLLSAFLYFYFKKMLHLHSQTSILENGWLTGDWLINFSAGFVRRGLTGEFAGFISKLVNIRIDRAASVIKVGFYILLVGGIYCLVLFKRSGLIEAVLFLAPWGLMFHLNDPQAPGRKEVALLALFSTFALLLNKYSSDSPKPLKRWAFWYMLFGFVFIVLIHEGMFFFLHYFLLFSVLLKDKVKRADIVEFTVPYSVAFVITVVLATAFRGDSVIGGQICVDLVNSGLSSNVCQGAITSLGGFPLDFHVGYAKTYIPAFILSMTPIFLYGVSLPCSRNPTILVRRLLLAMVPTLPLYVVAADWGRWIHISALMSFLSVFASKPRGNIKWEISSPIIVFFIVVNAWFYVFGWTIPHWVGWNKASQWYLQDVSQWFARFLY